MPDTPSSDVLEREFRLDLRMSLDALVAGEATVDETFADLMQLVSDELARMPTIERLSAELERVREAVERDAGVELYRKVYVPWTTVKEIMAAIRDRAALSDTKAG